MQVFFFNFHAKYVFYLLMSFIGWKIFPHLQIDNRYMYAIVHTCTYAAFNLVGILKYFPWLFLFTYFLIFFFLRPHLQHVEVLRLRVELELQLPANATATATPGPSHNCDLCCSLQQCQILNPLTQGSNPHPQGHHYVGFLAHWAFRLFLYRWPLNNMGFNCIDPLECGLFSTLNTVQPPVGWIWG